MEKQKIVIYIGDFDIRNENVQSHLVKNNAKILNSLGFRVFFIGVNKEVFNKKEIDYLQPVDLGSNCYMELENTLNFRGFIKYPKVKKRIMSFIISLNEKYDIGYVISYQSPTFAPILKTIIKYCRNNSIAYIVNCADITLFKSQPFFRRIAMTINWHYLHKWNRNYADGIIAVSSYIQNFYSKSGRPSIVIPPLFDGDINFDYNLDSVTTFVHAGYPFAPIKKKLTAQNMKDRLDLIVDWFIELSKQRVAYKLIIIGLSKDTYFENIPWQKEQLKNIPEIMFKGRCSHSETLEMVKNSDYMITYRDKNPMTEAGFPTKVVESVSLGTPVVINDVGDTLNFLHAGVSGYRITQDRSHNIALLEGLCGKTIIERTSSKKQCAQLRTFELNTYRDKVEFFLDQVYCYKRNTFSDK